MADGATIELEMTTTQVGLTPTAKEVTSLGRRFRLDGDELSYSCRWVQSDNRCSITLRGVAPQRLSLRFARQPEEGHTVDVENHVYPKRSRVEELMADASDTPVVMLNLLKFRAKAIYSDGRASDLSGRQAYDVYGAAMQNVIERNGGRVVFGGDIASLVIGEVDDSGTPVCWSNIPPPHHLPRS